MVADETDCINILWYLNQYETTYVNESIDDSHDYNQ